MRIATFFFALILGCGAAERANALLIEFDPGNVGDTYTFFSSSPVFTFDDLERTGRRRDAASPRFPLHWRQESDRDRAERRVHACPGGISYRSPQQFSLFAK